MSGDARRHPRFPTTVLSSTLGEVVNLSGGGACVRCKGRPRIGPGHVLQLTVQSAEQKVRVTARVVRVRRCGLWSFEVGLAFVDLKPGVAAALGKLAQFGFIPLGGPEGSSVRGAGGVGGSGAAGRTEGPKVPREKLKALMEMPDPYEQLGVPATAGEDEIKSAYRRIVRTCHPDVSQDPDSAARFIAATQAYEVLMDPASRAAYDDLERSRSAA